MQKVNRLVLIPLAAIAVITGSWAAENPNIAPSGTDLPPAVAKPVTIMKRPLAPAEYKRGDANFYPKAELMKANPSAVLISQGILDVAGTHSILFAWPQVGNLVQVGRRENDSYFMTTSGKKPPKEIYCVTLNDWIESITPPGATSLGIAPDAMQIREPRGDVQVALPTAPASFAPVIDGMTLPNGAVVKTGADGTAAVLFGGVDSARLMPNSEAAVQQTVTAQSRSVEVDLTAGGVFSKVGTQVGVKGDYEVHTPFGNASAHGGDFVTLISGSRTDVWVAQGAAYLEHPDSKVAETATSDGTGALKAIRFPQIADPHQAMLADVESFSAILNFIPMANQKIKALRGKMANGATLTADEQAYLARIKQVPALIKLAVVEPPAPVVMVAPPAKPKPASVGVRADGKVDFQHSVLSLVDLKPRLAAIAKTTPDQPFLIKADKKAGYVQIQQVVDLLHEAGLQNYTFATPPPAPPPVAPAAAPPAPAPAPEPMVSTPTVAPAPPAPANPINAIDVVVHADGTVKFQDATLGLAEFQSKLETMVKATPDQSIIIKTESTLPTDKLREVLDICTNANVKHVSVAVRTPASSPTPSPAPAAPQPTPSPAPTAVATPPPAPEAPPAAVSAPQPTPASQALSAGGVAPVEIKVRPDGNVELRGQTISLYELKWRLTRMANRKPAPLIVILGQERTTPDQLKKVVDLCHGAGLKTKVMTEEEAQALSTAPPEPIAPSSGNPAMPAPASTPTPEPKPAAPVASAPAPPAPANLKPITVVVHPDGTIKFKGATMDLVEFRSKLKAAAKATPDQALIIEAGTKVPYEKIKAVLDSCADAQIKNVSVTVYAEETPPEKTPPTAPTNPPASPASPAASAPAPAPVTAAAPTVAPAPPSPASPAPVRAVVRVDGKINFQGATYELPGFKSKLEAMVKAAPDQSIVIRAGKTVPAEKLQAVFDVCRDANVKYTSITTSTTPPIAPAAAPASNLPAPGLLMHSPTDSMTGNAPPMSPSGLPAPTSNTPATNAPAPASP